MTCREFIDFLMAYLSGELSSGARVEFEAHLQECPDCVVYLKSYELTIQLGKGAFAGPEAPVSADVPEKLIQAILASRRQEV